RIGKGIEGIVLVVPERSITYSRQERHVVRGHVGDKEILRPVSVEVAHGDRIRASTYGEASRDLKGPVPLSKENGRGIDSVGVGDDQVWNAIAIDVRGRHELRPAARFREFSWRLEGSVSVAERQERRGEIGDRQVRQAVAVKVRDGDRKRSVAKRDA